MCLVALFLFYFVIDEIIVDTLDLHNVYVELTIEEKLCVHVRIQVICALYTRWIDKNYGYISKVLCTFIMQNVVARLLKNSPEFDTP